MPAEESAIPLPRLPERLPPPPPPELSPCLDATAACLARHGLSRTSISDIAREMRVSRSTVYRQVGSVENAAWLLFSREMHAFFATLPGVIAQERGPQVIVRPLSDLIRRAWSDPVAAKVIYDEPDVIGRLITRNFGPLLDQGADMLAPLYDAAMDAGLIRRQDPLALAHWILRMFAALVIAPPPGDLDELLANLLLPVLTPA